MRSDFRIVFITASSGKEARYLAKNLLKERLAACVNSIPKVASQYWWKGKIESASETLLIVKTTRQAVAKLTRRVKELHSYSIPEIISCPIMEGNNDYLKWIKDSVRAS